MFIMQCFRCGVGTRGDLPLTGYGPISLLWGLTLLCQIPIGLFLLLQEVGTQAEGLVKANPLYTAIACIGAMGLYLCRNALSVTRWCSNLLVDAAALAALVLGCFGSAMASLSFGQNVATPVVSNSLQTWQATQKCLELWNTMGSTLQTALLIGCGSILSAVLILMPKAMLRLGLFAVLLVLLGGTGILGSEIIRALTQSPLLVILLALVPIITLRGMVVGLRATPKTS